MLASTAWLACRGLGPTPQRGKLAALLMGEQQPPKRLAPTQTASRQRVLSTNRPARLNRGGPQCCPTLGRLLEHYLTRGCILLLSAGRAETDKTLKLLAHFPPDQDCTACHAGRRVRCHPSHLPLAEIYEPSQVGLETAAVPNPSRLNNVAVSLDLSKHPLCFPVSGDETVPRGSVGWAYRYAELPRRCDLTIRDRHASSRFLL